jgi:deoxyguanosine kinase
VTNESSPIGFEPAGSKPKLLIVDAPQYIVVEGAIGVGKTSLTRKLADTLGYEMVLERPNENPFLERFYRAPKHNALPTQLYFIFQRIKQLQELKQDDMFSRGRVADFLLEKDYLFAQVTLDDDEFRLYQQVYSNLKIDVPTPDLVIYLQASPDVLMSRVRKRGVKYEADIHPDYLRKLSDAYTAYFHRYVESPLLIINASEMNFVEREEHYQALVEQIATTRSGRHFFNPLVEAL